LSPDHREILVLRDVNGMDYDEIAVVLKCRKGTVKSRLARAREQLRVHIAAMGGEIT
jgi:RNA polymerase sigma-70 factor, ECF subfamily